MSQRSPNDRQRLGRRAEDRVCQHLRSRGFEIVDRNVRVGRREIDVIAQRRRLVVFCEVRARRRSDFVHPLATIDRAKTRRIREAASRWLLERGWRGRIVRFDAAAVTYDTPAGRLDYREDVF